MSAPAMLITNYFRNVASFFRISHSYFRRRNPVTNSLIGFLNNLYNWLSLKKRLRSMRYQVQLQYYRMQQMDRLLTEYNPHNTKGGTHLNKYR